jgi:uncharacterized membrane protein YgaE (UPF0421/DUF939 family)
VTEASDFRARAKGVRDHIPTMLVVGISAGLAWFVADNTFGDQAAVFAPIAAALTLGMTPGDASLRRAIRVAVGVAIGLTVADAIVELIGVGAWQMGVVVILARLGTILADGTPVAVNQATVTAVLVVALHEEGVVPADRFLDALIGAAIALAAVAILRRFSPPS